MRNWLAPLRSRYIDFKFATGRNRFDVHIVERPGLWMNDGQKAELVRQLRSVVAKLNRGDLNYGVVTGTQEALERTIVTLITDRETGNAVAFNALSVMPCEISGQTVDVYHLGLVVVDPNCRAKGFSWTLYGLTTFLLFFRNRLCPIWISNVTQVPAIIGMVAESCSDPYPSIRKHARRSFEHLTIAREIMSHHRHVFGVGPEAGFDEELFIIRDAYTGGSDNLKKRYEDTAHHRNADYNEFCRKHLDYQRGDDFLQVGKINLATFLYVMTHYAPAESMRVLIGKAIYLFLESLALPVIRWLSPSAQFGELRPAVNPLEPATPGLRLQVARASTHDKKRSAEK
jgi:hypothetical protein